MVQSEPPGCPPTTYKAGAHAISGTLGLDPAQESNPFEPGPPDLHTNNPLHFAEHPVSQS